MKRLLVTFAATAFMTGAAFAQAASTYYIVQDASTKKCSVTSTMPANAQQGTLMKGTDGANLTFKTQAEAETRMKTVAGCT